MSNKKNAEKFLKLIDKGKVAEAYAECVDMKGKHHNFFFPAGFIDLQKAMQESYEEFPHMKLFI